MAEEIEKLSVSLALESGSFSKQISAINKEIKNSEREFKSASKGIEGFENSFVGLDAKIKSTSKQLELYNTKLNKQKDEYDKLSQTVDRQKSKLDEIESTLGKGSKEWEKQAQLVQRNSEKLSKLESDINTTENSINKLSSELEQAKQAFNDLGNKVESTDEKLEQINNQSELSQSEFNRLSTELQGTGQYFLRLSNDMNRLSSEIQSNKQKIEIYEDEIRKLGTTLDKNKQDHQQLINEIQQLENELNQAKSSYGENSREAQQLGQRLLSLKDNYNSLEREIEANTQELNQYQIELNNTVADTNRLDDELQKLPFETIGNDIKGVGEKLQGISLLFGGLATASVLAGGEASNYLGKIKGALGETTIEAKKTFNMVQDLAQDGFNFEEATQALITVKQVMKDLLDPSEIEDFTGDVLALSSTFDQDFNEVIRTTSSMIRNFGIDGEQALDIIAYGFQNGLNASDDWLDTLWEYSNQFSGLGFTAEQTLSIIKNGMDEGTFNTDKMADMIKEANIRLKEMGDTQVGAIEKLGLSTTEVQNNVAKGGEAASNQMIQLAQKVLEIKDPVEQNAIAVAIFGTMFEDLGINGVQALSGIGTETLNTKGAIDGVRQAFEETFGAQMAEIVNSLKEPLMSLGESMMPLIEDASDLVIKFSEWFSSLDEGTIKSIGNFVLIAAALAPVLSTIGNLIVVGGNLSLMLGGLSEATGLLSGAMAILSGPVGIGLAIVALVGLISKVGESESALGWLQDKFGSFGTIVGGICEFIAGIWNLTFDELVAKANLGMDLIAACIDGPGGATVKQAWDKYNKSIEKTTKEAWDNITLTTTRNLSQQKNSVDKETKDAADQMNKNTKAGSDAIDRNTKDAANKADVNTKLAKDSMDKNTKSGADAVDKNTKDASNKAEINTKDAANKVDENTKLVKNSMDTNTKFGADAVDKNMKFASQSVFSESGKISNDVKSNMDASVQSMKQAGSDIYNGMNTSFSKLSIQGKQHFSDLYNGVTTSTSKMANHAIVDWQRIRGEYSKKITGEIVITTTKKTVYETSNKSSDSRQKNIEAQTYSIENLRAVNIAPYDFSSYNQDSQLSKSIISIQRENNSNKILESKLDKLIDVISNKKEIQQNNNINITAQEPLSPSQLARKTRKELETLGRRL